MGMFIKAAIFILNAVYFFMKLGPVRDRVVFVSRQRDEPSEDYKALAATLTASGIETEMHLHRQEKDGARFMAGFAANARAILRQMKALAAARVAVADGYVIPISVLKHRKELTVFQIWHAIGAVKKFGLQTAPTMGDAERKRAKSLKMHEGYDFFAAPSEATARFFAEAFGMGADRALITGTPYLDALRGGNFDRRGEVAAAYPELAANGREGHPAKVVLYVPTYRGRGSSCDAGSAALRGALNPGEYIVIEKRHPIESAGGYGFSAEELMYAADIVVTDYSSLALTAALLGKPLYYYIYDIDEYRRSPGLNIDPEREYGKYAARGAEELVRLIREGGYDAEYEHVFAEKYVAAYDGKCTERLAGVILRFCGARCPASLGVVEIDHDEPGD